MLVLTVSQLLPMCFFFLMVVWEVLVAVLELLKKINLPVPVHFLIGTGTGITREVGS
jgi:hypothetical protein